MSTSMATNVPCIPVALHPGDEDGGATHVLSSVARIDQVAKCSTRRRA
jgi:hypothetical protein